MTAYLPLNGIELWHVAGWTMIHFLWLGTLVGLFAVVARIVLGRATPEVRYAVAIGCFALLAALPMCIAAWLARGEAVSLMKASKPLSEAVDARLPAVDLTGDRSTVPSDVIELSPVEGSGQKSAAPVDSAAPQASAEMVPKLSEPSPGPSQKERGISVAAMEVYVPYLPWLWIVGTPITFSLLTAGIVGTKRLRNASRVIDNGPIAELLARLSSSLRIGRRVTVAVCDRIAAPVLVGILRPLILLPPAALTGWSPDEIEMVLLHELAHVRRWDNLVNLVQRLIESLLFFHPVVWLVSNWVRREREACCDAAVVARTNRPHAYAEMLVALAAQMPRSVLFHPAASSAMAAGPLRKRIRSILGLQDDPMLISGKSFVLVLAGLLVAATLAVLYLPTIGQAEESAAEVTESTEDSTDPPLKKDAPAEKVFQARTQNNLKYLGLALLSYEASKRQFPAHAKYSADGKPLLSWRVLILPYLDEAELYSQFHLDEPWDSEHNRRLIARMPDVFQNPKLNQPGKTNYLAVVGEECVFDGSPQGLGLRTIADGISKTIAVVEADADRSVEWTKPQDWTFERKRPTAGLGSLWADYWNALWIDGSVQRIANGKPVDAVGINFTRAGGEQISLQESAGRLVDGSHEGVPGAEGGLDDARLKSLFTVRDDNPQQTRTHAVPPRLRDVLPNTLEGLRLDPYGPQLKFEAKWNSDHSKVELAAPKEAQEYLAAELGGGAAWQVDAEQPQPVPLPEAVDDKWPEGVAFPSPKDAEISRRAYEVLGLKIVPAKIEVGSVGAYEVEVVGGAELPPGATGPVYLIDVADENTRDFDELAAALQRVNPNERIAVGCLAERDGQPLEFKFAAVSLYLRHGIQAPFELTPQYREWLASHGDGPQKERVIAERAWKRLGMMLGPLSKAEVDQIQVNPPQNIPPSNIHIVGGKLPEGLPKDAFLTKVSEFDIQSFDDVLRALDSGNLQGEGKVRCYAFANGKEYLFEAGPPESEPQQPQSYKPLRPVDRKKFPSLEDQKMADLAFKRLGLELEPIDAEELGRVRALGYDGGVRVAKISEVHSQRPHLSGIGVFDILVGLHVWPTTSIEDVATVLARDDIEELSPLKFYVVRQGMAHGPEANPQVEDMEVTGRISVQTQQRDTGSKRKSAASVFQPTPTLYDPTSNNPFWAQQPAIFPALAPAPAEPPAVYQQPAPTPTADQPADVPVPESQRSTAAPNPYIPRVTIAPATPPTLPAVPAEAAQLLQPDALPSITPTLPAETAPAVPSVAPVAPQATVALEANPFVPKGLPSPGNEPRVAQQNAPQGANDKSKLHYEGKSFGEWRESWQTELSTEKRVEAVKALAAFGAAGYGEEATNAILDIVDQYDWQYVENPSNALGKLQTSAIGAFTGGKDAFNGNSGQKISQSIPSKQWLPILLQRIPEHEHIKQFSEYVLPILGPDAAFAADKLLELSRTKSEPITLMSGPGIRGAVLEALYGIDPKHENEQINKRWRELLDSKKPDDIATALMASHGTIVGAFQIDLMPLLLHEHEALQQQARIALRNVEPSQREEIVKALVAIVDDAKRSKDHIAAIRAIGAPGNGGGAFFRTGIGGGDGGAMDKDQAAQAAGWLDNLMMNPKSPVEVRAAAMRALKRITNTDHEDRLRHAINEENKDKQDTAEFRSMQEKLKQAIGAENNLGI